MKELRMYLVIAAMSLLAAVMVDAQTSKPQLTSTEPIASIAAITPSDVTTFTTVCRAIYVGGAGAVTVDAQGGGTNLAFSGVPAGTLLPVRIKRVYSTGTTATGILCLY